MPKKKRKKLSYPRKNKVQGSKQITLPQDWKLQISYDKGQLIIADKDGFPYDFGKQTVVRSYEGKNREHIVAQATGLDYVTDHVGSWAENFDFIFAMDTNTHTKKCGDFFCSAAAIYYGQVERLSEYERNMRCTPFMVIDWYHPVEMKIETVTWMESIKKIQEIIPATKKVGIVIDSELGKLEEFNNRMLPVFGQWYLPENYSFIYATADVSDEWCNKMIRQCDKTAKQRLNEIVASPRLLKSASGSNATIGLITFFDDKVIKTE